MTATKQIKGGKIRYTVTNSDGKVLDTRNSKKEYKYVTLNVCKKDESYTRVNYGNDPNGTAYHASYDKSKIVKINERN